MNRAVSTYCVASAASGPSHSNTGASLSHDRGRSLTSDFLASRARELIASLKSLMRSDSKFLEFPYELPSTYFKGNSKTDVWDLVSTLCVQAYIDWIRFICRSFVLPIT